MRHVEHVTYLLGLKHRGQLANDRGSCFSVVEIHRPQSNLGLQAREASILLLRLSHTAFEDFEAAVIFLFQFGEQRHRVTEGLLGLRVHTPTNSGKHEGEDKGISIMGWAVLRCGY